MPALRCGARLVVSGGETGKEFIAHAFEPDVVVFDFPAAPVAWRKGHEDQIEEAEESEGQKDGAGEATMQGHARGADSRAGGGGSGDLKEAVVSVEAMVGAIVSVNEGGVVGSEASGGGKDAPAAKAVGAPAEFAFTGRAGGGGIAAHASGGEGSAVLDDDAVVIAVNGGKLSYFFHRIAPLPNDG
jgi:hypothetical protein